MTLNEILKKYDLETSKGFSLYEIGISLSQLPEEERAGKTYLWEDTAFALYPTPNDNPWEGHYYGPICTWQGKAGELICRPAKECITTEAILYWKKRANETQNPLLKMQYLGLIWDFQLEVTGQRNEGDLYQSYVESMLIVCNEDYCSHPTETVEVLERLFHLSSTNEHNLSRAKQAFVDFEKRHATDDAPGLWSSRFQMMLQCKKCFSEDEQKKLIAEHEERLERLSTTEIDGVVNPWFTKDEAELLSEYYNKLQRKEDIKRVFNIVETTFERVKATMSNFQYAANIETLVTLYRHYGLDAEAARLTAVMQRSFMDSKDEMESIETKFEIPKEVYEQADIMFGNKASSDEERWNNFAFYFIPSKKKEEESLKISAQKHFFLSFTGDQLMDLKGRPMSKIGTIEQDFEGNLALHIAQKLNIQQYFLAIAINRLLTSGTLTIEKIMQMIQQSPLFEKDRFAIIGKALQFFIDGEYILFSHLIVPQIENAICNLVEIGGESVLRPQKNREHGYQLKTLDELLRQPSVVTTLTEDGAYYMQLVLTDQRALNIRNLLCHGIMPPEYFDTRAAGRLLHVLVMLGMVRYQTKETKNDIIY